MVKKSGKPPPERPKLAIPGEDLAKLTLPELIELANDVLREIEIRAMDAEDSKGRT